MAGLAGFQATLFTVPLWPSNSSSRSPAGAGKLCLLYIPSCHVGQALHCLLCPHLRLCLSVRWPALGHPGALLTRAPVVDVDAALLGAGQHKAVVQAAQAGAHHKPALLVLLGMRRAGGQTVGSGARKSSWMPATRCTGSCAGTGAERQHASTAGRASRRINTSCTLTLRPSKRAQGMGGGRISGPVPRSHRCIVLLQAEDQGEHTPP